VLMADGEGSRFHFKDRSTKSINGGGLRGPRERRGKSSAPTRMQAKGGGGGGGGGGGVGGGTDWRHAPRARTPSGGGGEASGPQDVGTLGRSGPGAPVSPPPAA